jgi:Na+-transporting NADH:ubiquinone oxidoreductase subunit NqrB
MLYALLALQIVDTLLLAVLALFMVETHTGVKWLHDVLIPFMTSLSRFINPEKK